MNISFLSEARVLDLRSMGWLSLEVSTTKCTEALCFNFVCARGFLLKPLSYSEKETLET